ncbi:MAG: glycoside hydrolase family 3 N-terminal domain-containing protein [Coriobacteriia bacterium]|nr:glycoside hydrolase family 3 N-terminal domain-containing protein [Coriobacteriia bacterium]
MKKSITIVGSILLLLLLILPAAFANANSNDIDKQAEDIYNNMTDQDKISQILAVHAHKWEGKDANIVTSDMAKIFQDYHFGAFVMFADNTSTTEGTLKFVTDLQSNTINSGGLPLFMTPDQEGGVVFRFDNCTNHLGNMAVGATKDPNVAAHAGKITATELNAYGVTGNLAPCVDVNTNAGNPIIGLRSFGDDKNQVAPMGVAFMKATQDNNVLACAKHFPGHGDVATDSHIGLPCNEKNYAELTNSDLIPFKACIDNGLDAIMTAHIQYPNIDATKVTPEFAHGEGDIVVPATLSKKFMTDILKKDLGFNGLVCTDALTMNGIAKYFSPSKAIILGLEAGIDMFAEPVYRRIENPEEGGLYSDSNITAKEFKENTDKIIADITTWKNEKPENDARLKDACLKSIKTKIKTGIINYNPSDYTLDRANSILRSPENLATEYEDAAKANTVVQNNGTLPIKLQESSKVLFLVQNVNARSEEGVCAIAWNRLKANGLVPEGAKAEYFTFDGDTDINTMKTKIDNADYVIIDSGTNGNKAMTTWGTQTPVQLVNYCKQTGKKSIVQSIRLPYDCGLFPNADAVIVTYNHVGTLLQDRQFIEDHNITTTDDSAGPCTIESIETIFGNIGAQGKLPVTIPEWDGTKYTKQIVFPNGHGVEYGQVFNINNVDINTNNGKITITTNNNTITYSSGNDTNFTIPMARAQRTFEEGKDYTVSYEEGKTIITGIGDLVGTKVINTPTPVAQTGDNTLTIIICLLLIGISSLKISRTKF